MSPKYQIFISSTYEDLKAERDQVIKAVLEMGHIPVGMEMFSAADEEQWKIIQRQIDSSDYYVVIVAHRYGSMTDGISYTEKEYDYAISQGVPALGFVIDNSAEWPHSKYDTDSIKIEALQLFKSKVKAKPVQFWKSSGDLHAQVAIALMKTFNTQPRPGWIRADTSIGPEVSEEIARLSRENSKLQKLIQNQKNDYSYYFTNGNNFIEITYLIRKEVNIHDSEFLTQTLSINCKIFLTWINEISRSLSKGVPIKTLYEHLRRKISIHLSIDTTFEYPNPATEISLVTLRESRIYVNIKFEGINGLISNMSPLYKEKLIEITILNPLEESIIKITNRFTKTITVNTMSELSAEI